ncbi:hypothetical protein ATE84_5198 [Aquimarina sp. MAR_2010_214]|uniref:hypothetical protein n=1 Tax=Aquimarina sp. MAR_2010_214 TaxID=1250026 RepID=UPI000C6FF8E0|nr:hypothetical protein [Aquimarina sp. MAR_2010_214]PKV53064.1 hypothetical protein ATE84_5198 [Aquimarina sp. MAR_2010_214]
MNREKKESRILKLLMESGLIVFSVLLALIISEWRNNYNEKVKTEKILENINKEVAENQKFLKTLIPYHNQVSEKIKHIIKNDSLESNLFTDDGFAFGEFASNGIMQGTLNDIVWTVAKTDKISNRISLDKSRVLYEVYEQQQAINITIRRIIDFLSSREIQRKNLLHENVTVINVLFNELTSQEKTLNYKYENALQFLNKNK